MKKALVVLSIALLCSLLNAQEPPAAGPAQAARANNQFAFDLYRQLQSQDGNLFFSPYSISTALAMTRQGAGGETAQQMDRVLHLGTGLPAAAHRELEQALAPGTVEEGWGEDRKEFSTHSLQVANALWVQDKLPVVGAFEEALKNDFGAPLQRIDFRKTAKARKIINDWVASKTRDRILNIVPEGLPTPDALFAIANAIWFKAAWSHLFEVSSTREATFATLAGEEVAVPMMRRTGSFSLVENDRLQMVELPYRGRETSMYVLLPRAKDGLRSLTAGLTADAVAKLISKASFKQVAVKLPRFKITCPLNLTETLPEMGMKDAFNSRRADFSGMTGEHPLFISAVLHKAFVSVDEAGTEAAAATLVLMDKGGVPRLDAEFNADHPFLFLIRHRKTGCILFLGRVVDPR